MHLKNTPSYFIKSFPLIRARVKDHVSVAIPIVKDLEGDTWNIRYEVEANINTDFISYSDGKISVKPEKEEDAGIYWVKMTL